MKDYKAIMQTLQTVLNITQSNSPFGPTSMNLNLLGSSILGLASSINDDRQRLRSISEGKATDKTIDKVLCNMETHLNVDLNMLNSMEEMINKTTIFERLLRGNIAHRNLSTPFQVILPFLTRQYSSFSEDFQKTGLLTILRFQSEDTRTFYDMLAWYYVKHLHINFYNSALTLREKCVDIIEKIGNQLMEINPNNGAVASIVYSSSISEDWINDPPILWTLVMGVSHLFEAFSDPRGIREKYGRSRLIPGLPHRSYWRANDPSKVLLLMSYPGYVPGTGHYEVFNIDIQSFKYEDIASLTLLNEEIITIHIKSTSNIHSALYNYNVDKLSFDWISQKIDPIWPGDKFERLFIENSQRLRELDGTLTNNLLTREMMRSEGLEYDEALQPYDVIISRRRLTLLFNDKSIYSISINHSPFLKQITPSEPILVGRDMDDREIIILWPHINMVISLNDFTRNS